MTDTLAPNTDPSLVQREPVPFSGKVLRTGDLALGLYEVPPAVEYRSNGFTHVAVNQPESFDKFMKGGLEALDDGESLAISTVRVYDHPTISPSISDITSVEREGDLFSLTVIAPYIDQYTLDEVPTTSAVPVAEITVDPTEIRDVIEGIDINRQPGSYMANIAGRGDRLGETVKALGFDAERNHLPLPTTLRDRIQKLNEDGQQIPNVRLFDEGTINGEDYIASFAAGEFPVSRELGWYIHDVTQEHFRPLVIFGKEAMGVAQLYAQSVQALETIVGRDYPDSYEINKGDQAQKIELEYSGQEKIDHAAGTLDTFTTRLDGMTRDLDKEPGSDELDYSDKHLDVLTEMVTVILASPEQADQFMTHLKEIGSHSMDSGQFDSDVYMRELLARTQQHWGIAPQPKEIVAEQPTVDRGTSFF